MPGIKLIYFNKGVPDVIVTAVSTNYTMGLFSLDGWASLKLVKKTFHWKGR